MCEVFGIGRQQASKDINNYKRSIGPGNLEYDGTAKGYRPSARFRPTVTQGKTEEYLDILAGGSDIQQILGQLPDSLTATEVLSVPTRQIPPSILRPLILAAKDHLRVEVDYVSLNQPDREGRIIVPHTLVWTGCAGMSGDGAKKSGLPRFVLSRFRGEPEVLDASDHTGASDDDWHTLVTIEIAPTLASPQINRRWWLMITV